MAKAVPSSQSNIQFSSHKTRFKLAHPKTKASWIEKIVRREGSRILDLSYVFCTDSHLLKINRDYLNHDTLTDIITFDLTEGNVSHGTSKPVGIEGEIYISITRVRENARSLGVNFEDELDRVIIHGILHLTGYSDKTSAQKAEMRKKEEACLSLR